MNKNLIIKSIVPGMTVLDVGAGDFELAKKLALAGARVTAVDVRQPSTLPDGITFFQTDIVDYKTNDLYDVILLMNVLQFLKKDQVMDDVLPRLLSMLKTEGSMYIETFSKNPEPPFPNLPISSTYTEEDFQAAAGKYGFTVSYAASGSETLTQQAEERTYHYVDCILKRA